MGDCKCLKERGIAYECDNLRAENQELRAKLEKANIAIDAMLKWFNAEDNFLGSFNDRMDLCKYAEWAAKKANGQDVGEFEGVPRLVLVTRDTLSQIEEG